jgi:hypothetical protein
VVDAAKRGYPGNEQPGLLYANGQGVKQDYGSLCGGDVVRTRKMAMNSMTCTRMVKE